MAYTLNIGLARNDGLPDNRLVQVLYELDHHYISSRIIGLRTSQPLGTTTVEDWTEKTLIVQLDGGITDFCLTAFCIDLAQDCIAIRNDETGEGRLVGPNAEKWGAFNPDFFLEV